MNKARRPQGKEDVRMALIQAAAPLFAARGIRAVPVREIAARAQVNHGLVHRHFGGKHGLLKAVMNHLAGDVHAAMGPPRPDESFIQLLGAALGATKEGVHWRILARMILEGEDPASVQDGFPVVRRLMAAARRDAPTRLRPEALVTLLLTVSLGTLTFEPYLRAATGQSEEQWQQTQAELMQMARSALNVNSAGGNQ